MLFKNYVAQENLVIEENQNMPSIMQSISNPEDEKETEFNVEDDFSDINLDPDFDEYDTDFDEYDDYISEDDEF